MDKMTSDALLKKAQENACSLLAGNWGRITSVFDDAHEAFEDGKGPESKASFKFSISHATVIKKVKGQVITYADVNYGLRIHDATAPVPVGPKDDHPEFPLENGTEGAADENADGGGDDN